MVKPMKSKPWPMTLHQLPFMDRRLRSASRASIVAAFSIPFVVVPVLVAHVLRGSISERDSIEGLSETPILKRFDFRLAANGTRHLGENACEELLSERDADAGGHGEALDRPIPGCENGSVR